MHTFPGSPQSPGNNMFPSTRRGLTQLEVVVVLGMILLMVILFVVMYPQMKRQRNGSGGTGCAANLKGIGLGFAVYANENDDVYPIAAHSPAVEDSVGTVTYAPGMFGKPTNVVDPTVSRKTTDADTHMSTTRSLWMLVREGMETPKSFWCPSSTDVPYFTEYPEDAYDFPAYENVSYGIQVPYGKLGRPTSLLDARMPVAADKGPFSAALEAGAPHPGVAMPVRNDPMQKWAPWNSPNHGGDGQVVLFADSHADFVNKPIPGIKEDNIYTRWSDATGGDSTNDLPRIHGTPPTSNETPWSDTDSLIYP